MRKRKQTTPITYDGKSLDYYDRWDTLLGGFAVPQPSVKGKAGLYRAVRHGEVIFIGKGAGMRTGLYERLYDLRRPGDSGRRYRAGQYIHANLSELELQVAILGSDWEARKLTAKLLTPMIKRYAPGLNVDPDFVSKVIQSSYVAT